MLNAVERARDFFYDGDKLKKHRVNIMKIDSGWQESAKKYMGLYKEISRT
jgi:glycogen synthase